MNHVSGAIDARRYDLLCNYNPAYQDLNLHCLPTVKDWSLREGEVIADIGAGTGNLSIQIAKSDPFRFGSSHQPSVRI